MTFKIHKEGRNIILVLFVFLLGISIVIGRFCGFTSWWFYLSLSAGLLLFIFTLRFFRKPFRISPHEEDTVYSPCDGKVVVIEETFEEEYFKDKRIQISIFMSVWNVHINWYPVSGTVKFFKYHPGKYLVARHPKSSTLNERTSIVVDTPSGVPVLFRQIAGAVARRVVSYARENQKVNSTQEMGFIKFGSRVDIFLPLGTEILIKPGMTVRGTLDKIAMLKND